MTDTQLLKEICKEIRLLREVLTDQATTIGTAAAARLLNIDARWLTHYYNDGTLTQRYGAQRSGYKWSRKEIMVLQSKLLTGEIQIPKRR